jgi:hypothetical protein
LKLLGWLILTADRERRYGGLSENVSQVEENPERITLVAG